MVKEGKFREDLYHRLNVIRIQIPALRERSEDIPLLARHFLQQAAQELEIETKTLDASTESILCAHLWPGNVRQLQNTCRWLTVMASGKNVLPSDLPTDLTQDPMAYPEAYTTENWQYSLRKWVQTSLEKGEKHLFDQAMPQFEQILLEEALKHTQGHKQHAAKLLGWGRNTLTRKLKEFEK